MNKTLVSISASLLILALLVQQSQALTVGVRVGDWFVYKGSLVLWEAGPSVPFPPHVFAAVIKEFNETEWYKYTVINVSRDVVTFEVITKWKNGTETKSTFDDNMTSSFTMMVIGANLEEGTVIRPEFDWTPILNFTYKWPERRLNKSITVQFDGLEREVNVLDWLIPSPFGPPTTRQVYWWDKETGILVRYYVNENGTDFISGQSYRYVAVLELIDASRGWGAVIPENLNLGIILIGSAVLLVVGNNLRHKRITKNSSKC